MGEADVPKVHTEGTREFSEGEHIHVALTEEEIKQLEQWAQQSAICNMPLEAPTSTPVAFLGVGSSQQSSCLGQAPRLSESTRGAYAKRAAKAERARKGEARRVASLPRGRYHHKVKKASQERAKKKRWATQPLKSLMFGYGSWAISQEEWDEWIGPFWAKYKPSQLKVVKHSYRGSKDKPYRIYDISVERRTRSKGGVRRHLLFDGRDLLIRHASEPNELDIEKAPEGALLFVGDEEGNKPSLYLSKKKLQGQAAAEVAKGQMRLLQKKLEKLQPMGAGLPE